MKKILYLFCASLLVLASCSSDDNSADSTSSILPKTIKYSYPFYPNQNHTSTIVYDGNKIVSVISDFSRQEYTYDGNLIVKVTRYNVGNDKDVKYSEDTYTYANNKLATDSYVAAQFPTGEYKVRFVFIYNSDGTVKVESYYTDTTTGIETKNSYVNVCTYVNGNKVKVVNSGDGSNNSQTYVYEYDSKNNPFKNITGLDLLLTSSEMSSTNNLIKDSSFVAGSSTNGTNEYKIEYVYDANGYPTKKTYYEKDGETINVIVEFSY